MLKVLENPIFRNLFIAQNMALLGTGLATIALALLAFDIAGDNAGQVLGTALTIKMIAYVGMAPVAASVVSRMPRRLVLIGLEIWRIMIVCLMPFVSETWQIYLLIFLLQSGSAAYTPAFQATIPLVLPNEEDYTNALSLSRMAADFESLISPLLAALLLGFIASNYLFFGTAIGFMLSGLLISVTTLPSVQGEHQRRFVDRMTIGLRIFALTPRLRGLMAVNFAIAAVGAIVLVNTVVYVQGTFALTKQDTALALAAFGCGSMIAAFALPKILLRYPERTVMIWAAMLLGILACTSGFVDRYQSLLALWFLIGACYASALVPIGRLLRRSAHPPDLPSVFAAQFALSHACWLLAYPFAGWGGTLLGLSSTALILGGVALCSGIIGVLVWPQADEAEIEHRHDDLPPDHPHFKEEPTTGKKRHTHAYVIDDLHTHWPGRH